MSTSISSSSARRALVRILLVTAVLIGACGCGRVAERATPPSSSAGPQSTPASVTAPPPALEASFADLRAGLPAGAIGLAIVADGAERRFGDWSGGAAWSTIKVAISIAALRVDAATAAPLVTRAITVSDNDAAMALWQLLGDPPDAGAQVHAVLAEGASADTVVQTRQVYPPYSPFGQTQWAQTDAARFAYTLPCVPDAESVLERMRHISAAQQWGLAGPDTPTKGGWGPDRDGGYLVRQLALLDTAGGTIGVALAADPDDGSFATGVAMLDALGDWVRTHRDAWPGGHCTAPR